MKLNKTQKNFRRTMEKAKKDGKIRDRYGDVVKPEKKEIHINWGKIIRIIVILNIFLGLIHRLNVLKIIPQKSANISMVTADEVKKSENTVSTTISEVSEEKRKVYDYLKVINELVNCNSNTIDIYNKYAAGEIYTREEINVQYQKLNELNEKLTNAPLKGEELEYNSINEAESCKRILELLTKELTSGKNEYRTEIINEIANRNSYTDQHMQLVINLLEAYDIDYSRQDDGSIRYTIIY